MRVVLDGRVAVIAAAGLLSFTAVFIKLADVSPFTAAFFRFAYAIPPLVVLSLVHGRDAFRDVDVKHGLIGGVLYALSFVLWHGAIEEVGAGVASVLSNTHVVFIAMFMTIGSRQPSRRVAVATTAVIVGIWLVGGGLTGANTSPTGTGVILGVLSGLAAAGFLVQLSQASGPPATSLLWVTVVGGLVILLTGAGTGELDLWPDPKSHLFLATVALGSQVFGWLLISRSVSALTPYVVAMYLGLVPVGSTIASSIVLGEAFHGSQVVGIILVVAAVAAAASRTAVVPPLRVRGLK